MAKTSAKVLLDTMLEYRDDLFKLRKAFDDLSKSHSDLENKNIVQAEKIRYLERENEELKLHARRHL